MSRGAVPALSLDPFDDGCLANPYARHDALRDAGPVIWLERHEVFAMARFEQVQAASRDHEPPDRCRARGWREA